jgi:hypothetical protein
MASQNNVVSRRLNQVSPATQQQDALHVRIFFFKVLSLLCRVINDRLLSFGLSVAKSLVHVCVGAISVCVLGLYVQAFTPRIIRPVVSFTLEYCWCTRVLLNLVAAISNTGVLEVL